MRRGGGYDWLCVLTRLAPEAKINQAAARSIERGRGRGLCASAATAYWAEAIYILAAVRSQWTRL